MKSMTKAEFNNAFSLALEGAGNDFVNILRDTAPVDTGNLRNSIKYNVEGNKLNIRMNDYGYCVEFGTKPHIIRPVNAKALHWKSGGKDIFALEVQHPGTEPNPFIRNAITSKLRDIFYKNLKRQLT